MSEMPGCRVEVAWETPPRTRPTALEWTRVDTTTPLRSLTTSRGARLKVAELEAGEASALLDNRSRALDPGNASSPWAPNVKPRRRIRFVLEPDGEAERVLWTGFLDNLPIGWEVGDGWVELTAVDLLGLIAGDTLPPSVLHVETIDSAPVAYWPMTEESGRDVDDVVGIRDGELVRPIVDRVEMVPFDPRHVVHFVRPDGTSTTGQRMRAHPFAVDLSAGFTFAAWIKATGDWPNSTLLEYGPRSGGLFPAVSIGFGDVAGDTSLYLVARDGTAFAQVESAPAEQIWDRGPHRVVVTVTAGGLVTFYLDGAEVALHGLTTHADASAIDWSLIAFDNGADTVEAGWAKNDGATSFVNSTGGVGHVVIWDRTLTAGEVAADYAAGVTPWDGDLTSERLARVLDLAGLDADDLDLDDGTVRLGPARLDGGNLVEYLRKIVATDPGSAIFVTADGKLAFRASLANDPAPLVTLVGDPDVDTGTPYADVSPSYSLERVVNIAEVTRENGTTLRTENADSVDEWGPLGVTLDTLHRTASGARGAGARLTNRYPDPRTVLEAVELNGRRDDVPPSVTLDLEVNDPVEVIARPTGGGDPLGQLAAVEVVAHELDWRSREWRVSLELAEVVVLPELEWDAAVGWDQSVWPAT